MHGNLKPVGRFTFERWNRAGRTTVLLSAGLLALLLVAPLFLPPSAVDKLTTLWVYIILAVVWNLLAGFAGLVSVGQQGYFGAGAYLTLRFVEAGMPPWIALIVGATGAGLIAIPLSFYVLKLRDGEFAIATWVLAEVLRIIVMFDPLVQGDTGNSLIALNVYDPEFRRNMTYWLGLWSMAGFLVLTFWLLRSPPPNRAASSPFRRSCGPGSARPGVRSRSAGEIRRRPRWSTRRRGCRR